MFVSSTIIEDIRAMRKAGLASFPFFYRDFREDRKMEFRGLLSSFLVQLYNQSDSYFDVLFNFYSQHEKGSRPPSDDALSGCLKDLLNLPVLSPVYLIVDALDEFPNSSVVRSPRAEVLCLNSSQYRFKIYVYASLADRNLISRMSSIPKFSALFPCMKRMDRKGISRTTSSRSLTRVR